MRTTFEAFFLTADQGRAGQRFCIFHPARGAGVRGVVVYVHPFAEEMNKSRRMAAMQSRAMAEAGFAVLQIDLLGCGDSSGDFGDATWDDWVGDVMQAARWVQQRHDGAPLWLWGLRAGALVAVEAARQSRAEANFLFWQPSPAGKPLVQQFLRLKAAGNLAVGNAKAVMEEARAELIAGRAVHVAGYWLSPALVRGLEIATLSPPAQGGCRVLWLEISSRSETTLSPASAAPLARWQQSGFDVHSGVVSGPPFWQTTEIEDAPALLDVTLRQLPEAVHA